MAERDSTVVKDYEYTPFEDAREWIRLLKFLPSPKEAPFRAEISHHKLCDAPAYKALSYTWGPPSDAFAEIEICPMTGIDLIGKVLGEFGIISQSNEGEHETHLLRQRFQVSLSLEAAIRGLQPIIGSVPIWIDAICIDQKNHVEKGHQVLFMDRIYRRADEVYIWLGEEAEESGLAMDLLSEYELIRGRRADKEKDEYLITEQFTKRTEKWTPHWRAFGKLIKRAWFSRRWIIQENVFAQQKSIFCGTRGAYWHSLNRVAALYHHYNCRGEKNGLQDDDTLIQNLDWAAAKVKNGEEHDLTLATLLAKFFKSCCTDPRDAVYSLVSMARDINRDDWLPEYSTKSDELMVLKKAFEYLVHTTQSLDMMCRTTKLPAETVTWLPKFGQVYGCDCGSTSGLKFGYRDASLTTFAMKIWDYPLPVYSASGSTRPRIRFSTDGRLLLTNGYLVDIIKKIPPCTDLSHCRSCNRIGLDLHQYVGVAWDIHQGSRDVRDVLECYLRSVVGNRTLKRDPALKWDPTFKSWIVGKQTVEMLSDAWINILIATSCFTYSCGCDLFDLRERDNEIELLLMYRTMNIITGERSFAVTERSLGWVPQIAQEGDVVGILLGCSVPVILRPCTTSSGYTFVGECYIQGLMEGEHMQIVSEKGWEPYEIEIH